MERAVGQIARFNVGRMAVDYPNGGRVIFRSLDDPDNARGHTADGVIIDEAGYTVEGAWYGVLRPMLSDTGGWAFLGGTPNGRNWFWREWAAAQQAVDAQAWQIPTLGCRVQDGELFREPHPLENPFFPWSEALRLFDTLPTQTFEQEFLAQFIEGSGAVFRDINWVSSLDPRDGPEEGHEYIMGVDWAKSYDWTVISIVDANTKRQVYVDRFNQISYVYQIERLKRAVARWQPSYIVVEANAMGEPLCDYLEVEDLPIERYFMTIPGKTKVIEDLAMAIEHREITLLQHPQQIIELQAYERHRLPGGTFQYGAPKGLFDDMVVALALAWHGALDAGPVAFFV